MGRLLGGKDDCSPKLESQELINTYMSVITVGETVSVEICS